MYNTFIFFSTSFWIAFCKRFWTLSRCGVSPLPQHHASDHSLSPIWCNMQPSASLSLFHFFLFLFLLSFISFHSLSPFLFLFFLFIFYSYSFSSLFIFFLPFLFLSFFFSLQWHTTPQLNEARATVQFMQSTPHQRPSVPAAACFCRSWFNTFVPSAPLFCAKVMGMTCQHQKSPWKIEIKRNLQF